MPKLKAKLIKNDGFVAIIALGIFALLSIFGIIVHSTTIETIESIKNINKHYEARDMADSVSEFLLFLFKDHEAGFNIAETCLFGDYIDDPPQDPNGDVNGNLCKRLSEYLDLQGKNIYIRMEIKGRSTGFDESFGGDCVDSGLNQCYVVPFPGTGSAGDRCRFYEPIFTPEDGQSAFILINSVGKEPQKGSDELAVYQIDYSCNWNKLTFGSSTTDRAAVPFYYENEEGLIISPFHGDTSENGGSQSTQFYLRVRTPCLPCVYEAKEVETGKNRLCELGDDPTICEENLRYRFKPSQTIDEDDVLIQWQFTGTCLDEQGEEEEECGLIPYVAYEGNTIKDDFSGITEGRIDNSIFSHSEDINHKLLYGTLKGIDTSTYEQISILDTEGLFGEEGKVPTIKQPILTLFLSGKLISSEDANIPYLEYQVITDQPIGNPSTKIDVSIDIDGNLFEKTIYQDKEKELIDFAIQN